MGRESLSRGWCGKSTWSDQGRSHWQESVEKNCASVLASPPPLSHMHSGIQGGAPKEPPQSGPGTRWGCPSSQAESKGRQGTRPRESKGFPKLAVPITSWFFGVTESMKKRKSRTAIVLPGWFFFFFFLFIGLLFNFISKARGASLPRAPSPRLPSCPLPVCGLAGLSLSQVLEWPSANLSPVVSRLECKSWARLPRKRPQPRFKSLLPSLALSVAMGWPLHFSRSLLSSL